MFRYFSFTFGFDFDVRQDFALAKKARTILAVDANLNFQY